jgi:hypothetical protein
MMIYPNPTPDDQSSFLLRLYFGDKGGDLEKCNKRAYMDLSRTVWGINKGTDPEHYQHAEQLLRAALTELPGKSGVLVSRQDFDSWHQTLCERLKVQFGAAGYIDESGNAKFTYGQAQKWINMALKYVFVFGERRLPGYQYLYPYCHVPIDNIIIANLRAEKCGDVPDLGGKAWSRLDDYATYMNFQQWMRTTFTGSAPLAVEFFLWQKGNAGTS